MLLNLDKKYRITTDSLNFILEKYEDVKKRGTEEIAQKWQVKSFHSNLEHALLKYVQEIIFDQDATDVHNLMCELRNIRESLPELIKHIDEQMIKQANTKKKVRV